MTGTLYGTPRAHMVDRVPVVPARNVTWEDQSLPDPRPDIPHHGIPSRSVQTHRMRSAGRSAVSVALLAVIAVDAVLALTFICIWK